MPPDLPLGEYLRLSGAITARDLETALSDQQKLGGRIGDRLLLSGKIRHMDLNEALAKQLGTKAINLRVQPPDPGLSASQDIPDYLQYRFMPWRRDRSGALYLVTVEPSNDLFRFARKHYGQGAKILLVSPRDWQHAMKQRFGKQLETPCPPASLAKESRPLGTAATVG